MLKPIQGTKQSALVLGINLPHDLILTTKATIDNDSRILAGIYRQQFLIIGRDIERATMLRYLKTQLSDVKWQQLAKYYDFDRLDAEYPYNPLLELPHHGQTTPQSFTG